MGLKELLENSPAVAKARDINQSMHPKIEWSEGGENSERPISDLGKEKLSKLQRFKQGAKDLFFAPEYISDLLRNKKFRHRVILFLSAMGIVLPAAEIVKNTAYDISTGRYFQSNPEVALSLGSYSDPNGVYHQNIIFSGSDDITISWMPIMTISSLMLLHEIFQLGNEKKKIRNLFKKMKSLSSDPEYLAKMDQAEETIIKDFSGLNNEDKAKLLSDITSLISEVRVQKDVDEAFRKLESNLRGSSTRVLVGTLFAILTLNLATNGSWGGIRPFATLRSFFPLRVQSAITSSNLPRAIRTMYDYILFGEGPDLAPVQRANDSVYTGDTQNEELLNFSGDIGNVEGENVAGYYSYGFWAGPILDSQFGTNQNLAAYTGINRQNYLNLSSERTDTMNMIGIELAVNTPNVNGTQINFSYLLTRLPSEQTTSVENSFTNPYIVGDITINAYDANNNRTELVEGVDYEVLTNPIGFSIIRFLRYNSSFKYTASYELFRASNPTNFDYETGTEPYRQSLLDSLRRAYPEGIIDIVDSDALLEGVDFNQLGHVVPIAEELMDEAVYDINVSNSFAYQVPEFIQLFNSDALLELYCTNTAQAVDILTTIFQSGEFEIRINGQPIQFSAASNNVHMLMSNGFSIERDGIFDNVDRHAWNVVNWGQYYSNEDLTPSELSPDLSQNTLNFLQQKSRTSGRPPARDLRYDYETGLIDEQIPMGTPPNFRTRIVSEDEVEVIASDNVEGDSEIPLKPLLLPTAIGLLVFLIMKKPRLLNRQKKKNELFKRFNSERDLALMKVFSRQINEYIYADRDPELYGSFRDENIDPDHLFDLLIKDNSNNKTKFAKAVEYISQGYERTAGIHIMRINKKNPNEDDFTYDKDEIQKYLRYLNKMIQSSFI